MGSNILQYLPAPARPLGIPIPLRGEFVMAVQKIHSKLTTGPIQSLLKRNNLTLETTLTARTHEQLHGPSNQ